VSYGGSEECGAIQWEETLWLRRKFAGRREPNSTSLVSILTVEVVGYLHYFNGFPNDMKMTGVDVC
jgi:hypothetical protein